MREYNERNEQMKIRKIKNNLLFLILPLVFVAIFMAILFSVFQSSEIQKQQAQAEQIILSYIKTKGLEISPGTEAYANLMKGILLGEHPDLTEINTPFVKNTTEQHYIIEYAAKHMKPGNPKYYPEPGLEEAPPIP